MVTSGGPRGAAGSTGVPLNGRSLTKLARKLRPYYPAQLWDRRCLAGHQRAGAEEERKERLLRILTAGDEDGLEEDHLRIWMANSVGRREQELRIVTERVRVVLQHHQSGMSDRAFCARGPVSASTLARWRRELLGILQTNTIVLRSGVVRDLEGLVRYLRWLDRARPGLHNRAARAKSRRTKIRRELSLARRKEESKGPEALTARERSLVVLAYLHEMFVDRVVADGSPASRHERGGASKPSLDAMAKVAPFSLIRVLAGAHERLTLEEISAVLDCSPSTVSRFFARHRLETRPSPPPPW